MDKLNYVHSRGGAFGPDTDTSAQDIAAAVEAALAHKDGHLILHFHGGLVSKQTGLDLAGKLLGTYEGAGHSLFFVWESGFFETLRNNFAELADEPVVKQLLRKVMEHALKRLGSVSGTRSIAPAAVDARQVREAVDRFWADPRPENVPYRHERPHVSELQARSSASQVNEAEIQADLENDPELRAALAGLPGVPTQTRSSFAAGLGPVVERDTPVADILSHEFSSRPGQRGFIAWFKVAAFVVACLRRVLKRYAGARDHGLYATVLEEITREIKLGGSSLNQWGQALQWNRMKQDTLDAFQPDADRYVGTALVHALNQQAQAGRSLKRISLIGHSTGAIYIAQWLKACAGTPLAQVPTQVLFLAPAITYSLFDQTLRQYWAPVRRFRMFAMTDELERDDQVWGEDHKLREGERDWRRFIYPSSLLYLVSGILETQADADGQEVDTADTPLLGMERFYRLASVFDEAGFPAVVRTRQWLDAEPGRLVWSRTAEGTPAGLQSHSIDHGGFDNDELTLASLQHALSQPL